MRAGELDVAIVNDGPALDGLTTHHLLDDPQFVAMSVEHRLARRKTVRLTELADEHWIAGSTTVAQRFVPYLMARGGSG